MHPDEVIVDADTVRRLVSAQFPCWQELVLTPVSTPGTDNVIYRLGSDKVIRLPRRPSAAGQVAKQLRWLPVLAPRLPIAIPVPVGSGVAAEGFAWPWSVHRWLAGTHPRPGHLDAPQRLATDVARFLTALRAIGARGGPKPGAHNFFRGVPLADRDVSTRSAIVEVSDEFDSVELGAAWAAARDTDPWSEPGVWIHGDLSAGNLLCRGGGLAGVIDWGGLAVGDPACDLAVAWEVFGAGAREQLRSVAAIDPATWQRGRGWALSIALIQLPYYRSTRADIANRARRVIGEVLAEYRADR